ncbi:MAG: hypothetical protein H0X33_09335 [Taibaiella sp.]|nr:hypothetical protein [Taibaiella sp.]
MKKLIVFAMLWICWGYALGTLILLGPLRQLIDFVRTKSWTYEQERIVALSTIGVLIVISFLFALLFTRIFMSSFSFVVKTLIVAIPLACTAMSIFLFLHPAYIDRNTPITKVNYQFTIGPYPDLEKMEQLKKEGYTAIISLLHPAIIPFEPKLISEETENAQSAGIQMINIPLLPWIAENEDAIERIRELVRTGKGKYYIHCYLGRDRANVVKRIILQESKAPIYVDKEIILPSINNLTDFERGPIYRLDLQYDYLTPMPTKEEYITYIVAANFQEIVALCDTSDDQISEQYKNEKKWLATYKIPYKQFFINERTSENTLKTIAHSIKGLSKPFLVHVYNTKDPITRSFMKAYMEN